MPDWVTSPIQQQWHRRKLRGQAAIFRAARWLSDSADSYPGVVVEPLLDEVIVAGGRRYWVAWFDPPFRPPLEGTTQALGVCFAAAGRIVLVTRLDGDEAPYYQTRFWARVELDEFSGEHEVIARRLVWPDEFRATLFCGREATAGAVEQRLARRPSGRADRLGLRRAGLPPAGLGSGGVASGDVIEELARLIDLEAERTQRLGMQGLEPWATFLHRGDLEQFAREAAWLESHKEELAHTP